MNLDPLRPFRSTHATEDDLQEILRLKIKVTNLEHENAQPRSRLTEMADEAKKLALHVLQRG